MTRDRVNDVRAERGWPPNQRGVRHTVGRFDREVCFEAGHALDGTYGRSALKIRFLLHGEKGTTQFLFSTGITPEQQPVTHESAWGGRSYTIDEWMLHQPSGFDRGFHADEPQYGGQDGPGECEYRPSGKCYYDGSGLAGDELLKIFLTQGEEAMWKDLEECYEYWFEGKREDEK